MCTNPAVLESGLFKLEFGLTSKCKLLKKLKLELVFVLARGRWSQRAHLNSVWVNHGDRIQIFGQKKVVIGLNKNPYLFLNVQNVPLMRCRHWYWRNNIY